MTKSSSYPSRIVCLTEETTETLYLLGQGHRVVGVSGYTVRPPEARQKPKVSAFINARFDKIEALEPDLVLAFSDLQADLAAELVRRGIAVVSFNQRTIAEILQMIRMLGGLVGCQLEAAQLADRLMEDLDRIRMHAARFPRRLRAFFEEWDNPLISGIRWVEELVESPAARRSSRNFPTPVSRVIASSILPTSRGAIRKSSSRPGAERKCGRPRFKAVRDGTESARFGTTKSSRSSRPTFCSQDRRVSRKGSGSCTRFFSA